MSAEAMALATSERTDFAELLAGLTPQQWDAPTLCDRWRVREVAAHTISFDGLGPRALVTRFVRGLLSVNRINALGVADLAEKTPEQLVELMRTHARPSGLAAGFGGRTALTDNMIHHQDIRRPLGLPRVIPAERLRIALDFARASPLIRGGWRGRGVRLVATDVDWAAGSGPEVRGSGEPLLMTMAGRSTALADLDGPGLPVLARHLGA